MQKLQTPWKKSPSLFTRNPPLKIEILSGTLFLKFGRRLKPLPQQKGGVHTMVTLALLCLILGRSQTENFWGKTLKIIDKFPPGAFYSHTHTPLTIRHKRVADVGH